MKNIGKGILLLFLESCYHCEPYYAPVYTFNIVPEAVILNEKYTTPTIFYEDVYINNVYRLSKIALQERVIVKVRDTVDIFISNIKLPDRNYVYESVSPPEIFAGVLEKFRPIPDDYTFNEHGDTYITKEIYPQSYGYTITISIDNPSTIYRCDSITIMGLSCSKDLYSGINLNETATRILILDEFTVSFLSFGMPYMDSSGEIIPEADLYFRIYYDDTYTDISIDVSAYMQTIPQGGIIPINLKDSDIRKHQSSVLDVTVEDGTEHTINLET